MKCEPTVPIIGNNGLQYIPIAINYEPTVTIYCPIIANCCLIPDSCVNPRASSETILCTYPHIDHLLTKKNCLPKSSPPALRRVICPATHAHLPKSICKVVPPSHKLVNKPLTYLVLPTTCLVVSLLKNQLS